MDLQWINSPAGLVVTALAAFRLTRVVVADAFPLGTPRLRFRDWANRRWAPLQEVYREERGEKIHLEPDDVDVPYTASASARRKVLAYDGEAPLAYLVTCYWCAGLYLSVACFLLACTGPWWLWAATPLAVSAVVGLLGTRD